jgi:hypothetical protein
MKKIGIIDGYNCGVMYRIECWLEAMGIPFDFSPTISKSMMLEKGACSGKIRVMLNRQNETSTSA